MRFYFPTIQEEKPTLDNEGEGEGEKEEDKTKEEEKKVSLYYGGSLRYRATQKREAMKTQRKRSPLMQNSLLKLS
jgi:hypothetical protein